MRKQVSILLISITLVVTLCFAALASNIKHDKNEENYGNHRKFEYMNNGWHKEHKRSEHSLHRKHLDSRYAHNEKYERNKHVYHNERNKVKSERLRHKHQEYHSYNYSYYK